MGTETTKPSLDWYDDDMPPDAVALVINMNGDAKVFNAIPTAIEDRGFWRLEPACGTPQFVCSASNFRSYKPGTCNWADSLVVRPGYNGDKNDK